MFNDIEYIEISLETYNHSKEIVVYSEEIFGIHPLYPEYMISNYGTIIHNNKVYIISQHNARNRYCRATLKNKYGERVKIDVHRHILEVFCPVFGMNNLQADHINGNRIVNIYDPYSPRGNLRWLTPSQNVRHSYFLSNFGQYYNLDFLRPIYYYITHCYNTEDIIDLLGLENTDLLKNLINNFADQIYQNKEMLFI